MLSDNPEESGIQYQIADNEYRICITQQDVDDVNNNGVIAEALPLSTKNACTGDLKTSSINITFTRNSVAYTSNGAQVGVDIPRFEQGKFDKAVMVEEGTTNLLQYSEDFSQSVWFKTRVDISSAGTYLNYPVTRFTPNTPGQPSEVSQTFLSSGAANRTFTWSFWARGQTNRQFRVNFYGGASVSYTINLTTEWQKFVITHTFPPNATSARIQWGRVFIYHLRTLNVAPYWGVDYTDWIEVAGVQVEEKPYATSYIKTTSSSATRSPETLTIPTAGVLNPQEGTVEFWLPAGRRTYGTNLPLQFIVDIGGTGSSGANVHISTEGKLRAQIGNGTVLDILTSDIVLNPNQAYYVAFKWWSGYYAISVNGVTKIKAFNHNFVPYSNLHLGCDGGYQRWLNGLIDDLRISSRARTDEEIAAAYASGQPLPVDAWTTLKLDFNGDLSTQSGVIP